jgi:hypothetical protein
MATSYHAKKQVKDRIQDLVVDNSSSTQSLLNAYKLKSELKTMNIKNVTEYPVPGSPMKSPVPGKQSASLQDDNDPYYKIRTLDPLIVMPEKRFEHRPSAVITANATHSRLKPVSFCCVIFLPWS